MKMKKKAKSESSEAVHAVVRDTHLDEVRETREPSPPVPNTTSPSTSLFRWLWPWSKKPDPLLEPEVGYQRQSTTPPQTAEPSPRPSPLLPQPTRAPPSPPDPIPTPVSSPSEPDHETSILFRASTSPGQPLTPPAQSTTSTFQPFTPPTGASISPGQASPVLARASKSPRRRLTRRARALAQHQSTPLAPIPGSPLLPPCIPTRVPTEAELAEHPPTLIPAPLSQTCPPPTRTPRSQIWKRPSAIRFDTSPSPAGPSTIRSSASPSQIWCPRLTAEQLVALEPPPDSIYHTISRRPTPIDAPHKDSDTWTIRAWPCSPRTSEDGSSTSSEETAKPARSSPLSSEDGDSASSGSTVRPARTWKPPSILDYKWEGHLIKPGGLKSIPVAKRKTPSSTHVVSAATESSEHKWAMKEDFFVPRDGPWLPASHPQRLLRPYRNVCAVVQHPPRTSRDHGSPWVRARNLSLRCKPHLALGDLQQEPHAVPDNRMLRQNPAGLPRRHRKTRRLVRTMSRISHMHSQHHWSFPDVCNLCQHPARMPRRHRKTRRLFRILIRMTNSNLRNLCHHPAGLPRRHRKPLQQFRILIRMTQSRLRICRSF